MEVRVIRSNRKTIALQVNYDLSVTVRAPRRVPMREIERILEEKASWIQKQQLRIEKERAKTGTEESSPLTREELEQLVERALAYIPGRVRHFASVMGVDYGRITIRNQKTRWGSCSSKGNLNFNCALMLTPPEIIDYIVVHELCHRKQMNHSKDFWNEVAKVMPEYRQYEKWLHEEGGVLIKRVHA